MLIDNFPVKLSVLGPSRLTGKFPVKGELYSCTDWTLTGKSASLPRKPTRKSPPLRLRLRLLSEKQCTNTTSSADSESPQRFPSSASPDPGGTCLSKGTGSALKGNRLRKNSRTYVQISICLGKASKKSPKPSTKVTKILPNGAKRLLNGATWTHQELPKGSSGTQLGPLGYPGGPHGPHRGHREPPRSPMGSTGDPKVTHLASF